VIVFIVFEDVCKCYYDIRERQEVVALDDVSLGITQGEFATVIGPSGCGKTTLLNLVAGFEPPTSGRVLIEGCAITGPGPDRGVVFQEYALFPWLTTRQNVEYGLLERRVPAEDARERTDQYLRLVGLAGWENRYPHELSGGMRQRAALARVLVNQPKILLMDEPFAAVDAQTRAILQRELVRLWELSGQTVLFITHSVEEAVLLGDRVIAMTARPGRIKAAIPIELLRPRDPTSPEFNAYRRDIQDLVGAEIPAAQESGVDGRVAPGRFTLS
jgi:ABC-type nitrate/sulfonate/bicarbonate transport system ATPase subunit